MSVIKDSEYLLRLEKLAVIQSLNVAILTSKSATMALEEWCVKHELSNQLNTISGNKIIASTVKYDFEIPNQQQLDRLAVSNISEVKFRHVCLNWGDATVSEARNWYVENLLTVEMHDMLKNTNIPFGKVVEELGFYRQTFSSRLLYGFQPNGLEKLSNTSGHNIDIPEEKFGKNIFEHRALLFNHQHQPISEVWEVYNSNLLDFK